MAEMDAETQAHIEAQQRPPSSHEPRKLSGETAVPHERKLPLTELEEQLSREREAAGLLPSTHSGVTAIPPASAYIADRRERERRQILTKLDRIAPATLSDDERPELTIRVPCGGCGRTVELLGGGPGEEFPLTRPELDPESAGVMRARMLAAGWLRTAPVPDGGRFSGVMCDPCAEKADAAERERERASDRAARLSDSCLPKAMQGFRFDDMHASGYAENDRMLAITAARRWASVERVEGTPGLLLFGSKGAGKSRLAATAAFQRIDRWPVRWVSWPALAGQLLGAFDDEDRKVAMSVLNGTGALVLDDIARDDLKMSDWAKEKLFTAIDKRVQAGSPILVTTNLSGTAAEPENLLAALAERVGASTASRLAGFCRVIELPGDDMRLTLDYLGRDKKASKAEQRAAAEALSEPEERE